jgi:leader peptidase (prepilin peptidase)/N-methyltransferase
LPSMHDRVGYAVLAGVLGAVIGSFLNVVIYRLPRRESLIAPGSRCPDCGVAIKPYDNVPILGWLLLRGRCRACGAAISPRYPLVEAITAGLCVAVVLDKSSAAQLVLGLTLVLTLIPVAFIDLDHHLIPNRITGPAAIVAIAAGSALNPSGEPERLIAGAAAGGLLLLAALAFPRGMGMGDVKLAGVMGLLLGREVAPAIFAALVVGVLVGIGVIVSSEPERRREAGIPFGPCLALGGLVGLFAGHALVGVYLHHLT